VRDLGSLAVSPGGNVLATAERLDVHTMVEAFWATQEQPFSYADQRRTSSNFPFRSRSVNGLTSK
jgi:hypothetical protein